MQIYKIGPDDWYSKFELCLGKEFSETGYFKVHHLLVLSYMIQCDAYSEETKGKAYKLLCDFNKGIDPIVIVEYNKKRTNEFKIRKNGNTINMKKWRMTILDIRTNTADNYCEDVISWAKIVEEDLKMER